MVEALFLSMKQLLDEYPKLTGWIPEHDHVQLLGKEPLPSAQQKIAKWGGREEVIKRLEPKPGKKFDLRSGILLACTKSPMAPGEIVEFLNLLGRKYRSDLVQLEVGKLLQDAIHRPGVNNLYEIDNLLWVRRSRPKDNNWIVNQLPGYITEPFRS